MSQQKPKFCPQCGGNLGENNVCVSCGYNASTLIYREPIKIREDTIGGQPSERLTNDSFWGKANPYIINLGKIAWIILLIGAAINLIVGLSIYAPFAALGSAEATGVIVWEVIKVSATVALSILWTKPYFSDLFAKEDIHGVLNTKTLIIKTIRIPWAWIFGIIFVFITNYIWGWIVFGIVIILTFFHSDGWYIWKVEEK
jgi:hypothetical protein